MSLKGKVEAVIYAAEEPVSLEHICLLLKDSIAGEEGLQGADAAAQVKVRVRQAIEELIADYAASGRGMEIRQLAGGYRMATKAEHHDLVRAFAKSLKPPVRLSLPALETLAVIAYKQPVTAPEINEIRGVDSSGVIATLLDRKLVTTAGRKPVIGRPILYRTTREFLLRFGLSDVSELPSMEEFEKLVGQAMQDDLFAAGGAVADATGVPGVPAEAGAPEEAPPSGDTSTESAESAAEPPEIREKEAV